VVLLMVLMVTEFDRKAISHSFGVHPFDSVIEHALPNSQHFITKQIKGHR
jgi:hypothetical protein